MARFVTAFQDPAVKRAVALGGQEPENTRCVNCAEAGPQHVCLRFRTFVCEQCKDVHEEFGHKTVAVADPEWDEEDIDLVALEGGNKRAAAEWLAFWSDADFPRPTRSDEQRRRDFIRKAYVVKCWQRQPIKEQGDLDERGDVPKQQEAARAPPPGRLWEGGQATDSEAISSQEPAAQPSAQAAACSVHGRSSQEAAAEADAAKSGSSTPTTAGGDLQGDVSASSSDGEQPRASARPGSWLGDSPSARPPRLPAPPPHRGDVSASSSDDERPRASARPGGWLSDTPDARPPRLPALPPPPPSQHRTMPVLTDTAAALARPAAAAAAAEPQGEAWTADFKLPACSTVGSAAAIPAPHAAGTAGQAAGAAPGTPAAPTSPSAPMTPKLDRGGDPAGGEPGLLGSVDSTAFHQVPITPRTRPYQPACRDGAGKPPCHWAQRTGGEEAAIRAAAASPQGAAPAQRLPWEPKAPADRFAALDDVDEWEQEVPSAEFGELLEAFNEKAASWEQKGAGAAPRQGVGRVPAAQAASPGSGFDGLLAAAGFSWL